MSNVIIVPGIFDELNNNITSTFSISVGNQVVLISGKCPIFLVFLTDSGYLN